MSKPTYQELLSTTQLTGGNFGYLESLYEDYLHDPNSVSQEWQIYFSQLPTTGKQELPYTAVRQHFIDLAKQPAMVAMPANDTVTQQKQDCVLNLINNYRALGHKQAKIDPLNFAKIPVIDDLQLQNVGLTQQDLSTTFATGNFAGLKHGSLKEIINALQNTYCSTIGAEFMHISDAIQRNWLLQRFESNLGRPHFNNDIKLRILDRLAAAEGLENYLHTKFVGQKRFSLEGGDSLIPMLDHLNNLSAANKGEEVIIGMAHRGRLNVLVNILGQPPQVLFDQFGGKHADDISGDVKYHLGFSSDVQTLNGVLRLSLAFNPSHLEIVSPVVEGDARAKQDRCAQDAAKHIVPVLIHGDASVSGQGVVMETFNMSQVSGYKTGGSLHIVVNNQVGFTTDPYDDRSTLYCTDVAKMIEAPIFHVNGDDPEATLFVMQLAFEFRMKFNKDVVIDLVCYRRHGHNEADEPAATQPLLYKIIKQLPTAWKQYATKLAAEKLLTLEQATEAMKKYQQQLATGNPVVPLAAHVPRYYEQSWAAYLNQSLDEKISTGVDKKTLQQLGEKLSTVPAGFGLHSRIEKMLEARAKMNQEQQAMDWGFAENLAYATLLIEGHSVRISGQDSQRGTFFHRHAVLHNPETGEKYLPLQQLSKQQGRFAVINSILSEEAVMAFDMGYAMASPEDLVIWEAQFGDFANGAQVVVDQFLSAMEQKWRLNCGLVLLLPHGQEGQGPEHSSARLERYLQLCAQNNMQVCQPTSPAQMFHLLRRQVVRKARKPLIVMTPKSLLRHKLVVSTFAELTTGEFQLLIPEIENLAVDKVKKVIVCSGKVYYDLLEQRQEKKQTDVALIRIEQLYPFPVQELTQQLSAYKNAQQVVWCQEEPKNQGPWYMVQDYLLAALATQQKLTYVGRSAMAATASGYLNTFTKEQEKLINEALA